MKNRIKPLLMGACALPLLVPVGGQAAQADVANDAAAATLTNTLQQAAAKSAPQDPNVTTETTAGGRDVVQRTSYVIGEVYGQAVETATGEAISLDRSRGYTCRMSVRMEVFTRTSATSGSWSAVPGTQVDGPVTSATQGICVPVPLQKLAQFTNSSAYLDKYLRAHSWLSVSIAGAPVRHDYSPTWVMKKS